MGRRSQNRSATPQLPTQIPDVCACAREKFPASITKIYSYLLDPRNWACSVCTTTESMWACLLCGNVGCGRYTNRHAESHYRQSGHRYVIEVNEKSVYCYACNGYVVDDDKLVMINDLREKLTAIQRDRQPSRTRSGRLIRSEEAETARKRAMKDEVSDKMYVAICHWRLALMNKALNVLRENATHRLVHSGRRLRARRGPSSVSLTSSTASTQREPFVEEEVMVVLDDGSPRSDRAASAEEEDDDDDVLLLDPPNSAASAPAATNGMSNGSSHSVSDAPSRAATSGTNAAPPAKAGPGGRRKRMVPGQTGLRNLGNTCFLNSCLQSLSYTKPFRTFFLQMRNPLVGLQRQPTSDIVVTTNLRKRKATSSDDDTGEPSSLAANTYNLLRVLWSDSSPWPVVSPSAFLSSIWQRLPEFRGFMQHDAQEFLCTYLDKLDAELRDRRMFYSQGDPSSPPLSPTKSGPSGSDDGRRTIVSIFSGSTLHALMCRRCGHRVATRQPSSFVTLGGLAQYESESDGQSSPSMGPPDAGASSDAPLSVPLDTLLKAFSSAEQQDPSLMACQRCKSRDSVYRQVTLERLPEVLVIHINRIRWDGAARHKLQAHVAFPLEGLDVTPYVEPSALAGQQTKYDLYSVINHHGRHFGNGHYTTYCYSEESEHWLLFSDGRVAFASEEEVQESQAYMLFYIRRGSG